ncbi:MAG: AAA family ATPase [Candidatus Altiarchaeota archaeon]|nr:AAA family ATPase [Candidatus Altiarchaeota archaeon]
MGGKLFEVSQDGGMFKDLSVLSPHYVPKELPYRGNEIKAVTRVLTPILSGIKPNNLFLYGKTGTGKTSVVKNVLRELEEAIKSPSANTNRIKAVVSYMNCRLCCNTKYQVLRTVLESDQLKAAELKDRPFDGVRTSSLDGRSPTELYSKMRKTVESNALKLIIVLDEVDMIKDVNDLIYILTRINDEVKEISFEGRAQRGSVIVIGISNKYSFKNSLDPRTKSTLCEEEFVFKPYNAKQLKTILMHRVKLGLRSRSISESNVGLIAAYAAQTNGDARYALKLLQKCCEIAQSQNRKRVKREDVVEAKAKVEEDIIFELITTLPEHHQIALYSIADSAEKGSQYKRLSDIPSDTLFSGEVYESYEKVCKALNRSPKTMRWFGEYLKELEMLGLITLTISGSGVRGNTTLIRLGYPSAEIKKIISASLGIN